MEIPADLNSACLPVAWLLGTWEGVGVGDYSTTEAFQFGQQVRFTYVPGKPYLVYESATWRMNPDGSVGEPLARENGYWRPQPDGQIEVLLAHPTGIIEIYLGEVAPAKIEMATRGVLKTETAKDYRSATRLYGLVDGKLMWVMDMSALGQQMQAHVSAELRRVAGPQTA